MSGSQAPNSLSISFGISGKVALVTGGGSGIGRAIVLGLARAGVDVAILDISAERVESAVAEAQSHGIRTHGTMGDVGRSGEVNRIVGEVGERLGPIDFLVHCAGIYPRSSVVEMSEEEWDRVLNTNLKSIYLLAHAVLPAMVGRRFGRIVSMTSALGASGIPRGAHYAASKAALSAFTRSVAMEVMHDGIRINAIAPGLTDTPLMRAANTPEYIASLTAATQGGVLGKPEDVVSLALFLLSDGAEHINGQILTMRG